MNRTRAGVACALGAAIWMLVLVVAAGAHRAGYSHVSQFISELGEHGTPDGWLVSWFGFFPVGTLTLAAALLLAPSVRPGWIASSGVALVGAATFVGYAGSAVWRCDTGCPEMGGSTTQGLHYFVSAVDLVGVIIGLVGVAVALRGRVEFARLRHVSVVAAVIVAGIGSTLTQTAVEDVRGLLQRVVEFTIFGWLVTVALAASATADSPRRARP